MPRLTNALVPKFPQSTLSVLINPGNLFPIEHRLSPSRLSSRLSNLPSSLLSSRLSHLPSSLLNSPLLHRNHKLTIIIRF
jgi:hypothetical protein